MKNAWKILLVAGIIGLIIWVIYEIYKIVQTGENWVNSAGQWFRNLFSSNSQLTTGAISTAQTLGVDTTTAGTGFLDNDLANTGATYDPNGFFGTGN